MSDQQPMNFVNRAELDIMLTCMIRSPRVTAMAVPKVKPEDFHQPGEHGHKLIWSIALDFYKQHYQMVPNSILLSEIQSRSAKDPTYWDAQLVTGIYALANGLYAVPDKDIVPHYALSVIESFLYQRRILIRMTARIEQQDMPIGFAKTISDQINREVMMSSAPIVRPFDVNTPAMLGATLRQNTGIMFLDNMLGGGTKPRELYGFLAPSGGGKTTFANQLAIASATLGHTVCFFSYEEQITNDYLIPVHACAAMISRERLGKIGSLADLTPDELARYTAARKSISDRLHYIDMSGTDHSSGHGGVAEIDAKLIELSSMGIKPHLIIIDWFWPMMQRCYAQAESTKNKMMQERTFAQAMVDQLKQLVNKHGCWGWIAHQTKPAESMKKRDMEWTDAAEFASLAWLLNGCFVLNCLDSEQNGILKFSKARAQRGTRTPLHLIGEFAKFESRSGDSHYDAGQRKHVEKGKENVLPREADFDGATEVDQ